MSLIDVSNSHVVVELVNYKRLAICQQGCLNAAWMPVA